MTLIPGGRTSAMTLGGVLVAASSGLWSLTVAGYSWGGLAPSITAPLATVALAAGAIVLAAGRGDESVVASSPAGRIALVVLGGGPVVSLLLGLDPVVSLVLAAPQPWAVVLGTSLIVLGALATVVVAVTVARNPALRGMARWAPVLLAVAAVLNAVTCTVASEGLVLLYAGSPLSLLQPVVLLVWGVALGLRGRAPAIRRRVVRSVDDWKRTTDVGGTSAAQPDVRPSRR